jgi:hypothetical protein
MTGCILESNPARMMFFSSHFPEKQDNFHSDAEYNEEK